MFFYFAKADAQRMLFSYRQITLPSDEVREVKQCLKRFNNN